MSLKLALAIFGGFLLGLWFGTQWQSPEVKRWEERAKQWQADSLDQQDRERRREAEIKRLGVMVNEAIVARMVAENQAFLERKSAGRFQRSADSAIAKLATAATIGDTVTVLRTAYESRTEEVGALKRESGSLRAALDAQIQATARMESAYTVERVAHDSTKIRLQIAEDLIRDRPTLKGQSFWGRLLHPEVRPGGFAGICQDARPCAGAGLTLSWDI